MARELSQLLISIITPCLNRVGLVTEAINSVRAQDFADIEHIVIDGGSTDGTLEVLGQYPHLRVFSEPDRGVYDALNKGIRLARGDVIGFLNTDDTYEPGVFGCVASTLMTKPEIDAVAGGASIFRTDTNGLQKNLLTFPCVAQHELLKRSTQGAPIFNAWFFRKRLFDELGPFDSGYLYVADRDFLIRMAFSHRAYVGVDKTFYRYRMHPGSYTLSGRDSGESGYMFESRALARRYLRLDGTRPEMTGSFRAWHSQITMEQLMTAWRKRAFHRATGYAFVGLRYDPLSWPWVFLRNFVERFSVMMRGDAASSVGEANSLELG